MTAIVLKIIALVSMVIDHAASVFRVQLNAVHPWLYTAGRMIGRLAFPIFALGIAEGAVHTKSPKKYLWRMFLFAVIAQIPFSLMVGLSEPTYNISLFGAEVGLYGGFSVMVTLFLGLLLCVSVNNKKPFGAIAAVGAAFLLDGTFGIDYGVLGVMLVFMLYMGRSSNWLRLLAVVLFSVCLYLGSFLRIGSSLIHGTDIVLSKGVLYAAATAAAGLLMLLYNNKLGRKSGLVFYIFYPLHMLALWFIAAMFIK